MDGMRNLAMVSMRHENMIVHKAKVPIGCIVQVARRQPMDVTKHVGNTTVKSKLGLAGTGRASSSFADMESLMER